MARRLDPTIKRQEILRSQLWSALQGDMIEKIRLFVEGSSIEFQQRSEMATRSIRVSEKTMPEVYALLEQVKSNLEFSEDIELYIQASPDVNAYSYKSEYQEKPHIIILTSGLYNLMDDNEIRNIIGHEIGHIINNDSSITKLYNFVYSKVEDEDVPTVIRKRYIQYQQLAEYAADRYGYLGCMDLEASLSAFYKMNSGLDLKKMNVNIEHLTDENYNNIQYLLENGTVADSDHPLVPYRVGAIVDFAKCKTQKALEEQLNILCSAIPGYIQTDLDVNMARCFAASGLKLAYVDGKLDRAERNLILDKIAEYELESVKFLKKIAKEDIDKVFEESITVIKDQDPSKIEEIMNFYVELSFADDIITTEEIDQIIEFGRELGYQDSQTMIYVSEYIKNNYNSLSESL